MTRLRSGSSRRIRDRRGSGGSSFPGGLSGAGLPAKLGGGGVIGLILVIAIVVVPQLLGSDGGGSAPSGLTADGDGEDVACESEIEQIVCGAVDDVIAYWDAAYPETFQGRFPQTDTVLFSGATRTGCGSASAGAGPFYCPADQLVYLDLDALVALQQRFGATGDLAAQYIVAHEYGHHVQTVTGISQNMRAAQAAAPGDANELSVALELQADCFAGAWAASAEARGLFDRPDEVEEALNAAAAVGDDSIMESSGREVDPEQFTHGSADQRRAWFATGFDSGDPASCRTFDGALAP